MKTIFTCSHGAKREKGRLQDKFYLMLPFEHKKKKKTISSFHSTCIKLISGRIHTKRNTPFLRSEETDPHISAPGMTANAGRAVTKGTLPGDGGGSGNRHGVLEMKTGRFH